jgi:hypothetical protein
MHHSALKITFAAIFDAIFFKCEYNVLKIK